MVVDVDHPPVQIAWNQQDLAGVETVGVTAGASTPEWLIKRVVEKLESMN